MHTICNSTYWTTISSRLYNIRHELTIDGVFAEVPLFAPAINPLSLIEQVASGTSLANALQNIQVAAPYYRFKTMVERAKEVTQFVIQLGQSLLAAFEKKDAEQLSIIYSTNQQNILALTKVSKDNELNQINETIASLQNSLASANQTYNYYSNLISNGLLSSESSQLALDKAAIFEQTYALPIKGMAALAALEPNIFGLADGGMDFGGAVGQYAGIHEGLAQVLNTSSGLAGTVASFQRRSQEWNQQLALAQDELNQITNQILAAQYQQSAAQNEITILLQNTMQEQKVGQFLISKFTTQDLYQWLSGQLASMYFQMYQLAYKTAKKAEAAWEFEKAITLSQPAIRGGYWNNLYQGLLAGEGLMLDIQQMEQAYMDQDKRRLEIKKTISLSQLASDPNASSLNQQALSDLLAGGICNFEISQDMLDQDYPGHYCRQIKYITISLPAVLGPYQDICATLQQTKSSLYDSSGAQSSSPTNQQVALSQGMNDTGLMSFNIDDARYLPFEGTGAVSTWTLQVSNYNTLNIADVIIELNYTALPGGIAPSKRKKAK